MGYVERNLLPQERVVYKTRLHWVVFLKPLTLAAVGAFLTAVLARVPEPSHFWWGGAVLLGVGLFWTLVHYVEVMSSEFAVTTMRLILKVGFISRYTTELLLTKIETIGVEQGLAGRLLGYGDLIVTGTGGPGRSSVVCEIRSPSGTMSSRPPLPIRRSRGQAEKDAESVGIVYSFECFQLHESRNFPPPIVIQDMAEILLLLDKQAWTDTLGTGKVWSLPGLMLRYRPTQKPSGEGGTWNPCSS